MISRWPSPEGQLFFPYSLSPMIRRLLPLCSLGLVLTFFAPAVAQPLSLPLADLDRMFKEAMKQWQAPGLAVAIVRDDRVLYLKGFGVRELGQLERITPETVFPLASCTKPFTTLALAMLADEGNLSWDDPVRRHVPFFRLSDPLADANVTLRDLVCHRTGVASHDMLWYRAPWSLEERIRKVGKLELEKPFRSAFQYQTVLFGTAGLAAGRAAGCSWEDLVRQRILEPLGMKTASCTFPGSKVKLASPHRKDEAGTVRVYPRYPLEDADPAGSLHACASDLARFLRFQLGDGSWEGRRLVSARNLEETHTTQIALRLEGFARTMNPDTNFLTYGLGWIVQDYRGKRILMHGGAIDGFRAHFTLVPEARVGIALLNNLDGSFLNLALSNQLLDLYYGMPARDWSSYYLKMQEDEHELDRERSRRLRAEKKGPPPPLPLKAYVGTYQEAAYGSCEIRLHDGHLSWRWGKLDCPLEAFDGNTFLVDQRPQLIDALFTFRVKSDRVAALEAVGRVFRKME
jgi:CubicO group peptidase (beta-lactamase class C family)